MLFYFSFIMFSIDLVV